MEHLGVDQSHHQFLASLVTLLVMQDGLKIFEVSRCATVVYGLIKLRVPQWIKFSKLHQIYQDIILTPTLTITPNTNSDFENFKLLVKRVLYFRYFYIFSTIQNIGSINLARFYKQPKVIEITVKVRSNG